MTALLKLPARSANLVFAELPEDNIMWSKQIPMESYVDLNGLHYEYDEFMKLMYIKGAEFISTQQKWDDTHLDGLWANLRRVLAISGVIVLLFNPYEAVNIKRKTTIPWRYDLRWKPESGKRPERILSIFSPVFPCEARSLSKYYDALPYIRDDGIIDNTEDIHNSTMPLPALINNRPSTELYDFIISQFSAPDDTVLDLCMRKGEFGRRAIDSGRKFIGIEKDSVRFDCAKSILSEEELG